MLEIDGSYKSGSGTILRDALFFSVLLNIDIRVKNIRAKRDKPGLRPQHLQAVLACKELSGAEADGLYVGSKEIIFRPGKKIKCGDFCFDIGTAGSATMLASTLIPIGLYSEGPSRYLIRGSLFQDFAPTAFHMKYAFLPLIKKMGADIDVRILKPGYVPKGGGELEIIINPLKGPLIPLKIRRQGIMGIVEGIALSSHLAARKVSERMAVECEKFLRAKGYKTRIEIIYDSKENPAFEKPSDQEGAALAIWVKSEEGSILGSDMVGKKERSAESIGRHVALNLVADIESGATVDRFLGDQLIPFCALAKEESSFLFPWLTEHMESRIWIAEEMLKTKIKVENNKIYIIGVGFERCT